MWRRPALPPRLRRYVPRLGAAVLTVAALALPGAAGGQELWGSLELPGSVRAARSAFSLGLPEDRPDAAWLADYLNREFSEHRVLSPLSLEEYVTALDSAREALAELPDGLSLPSAGASATERARTAGALRALGLSLTRRGDQFQAERDRSRDALARHAALEYAGIDVDELAVTLNAGRPASPSLSRSLLPLPLPDFWTTRVFTAEAPPILTIAASRPHSLLYLALLAQEGSALAFLQTRPALVARLGGDLVSAFAAFGRSLRLRDGAVDVPGGDDATAIWQTLVGQHPKDAERFIVSLLERDGGRLAYFYDSVAQLTPHRQRYVLGHGLEPEARLRLVRRVAARFISSQSQWDLRRHPFYRPPFDPAVALMLVDIREDGSLGPRWLPALLDRVVRTEAWPARPERLFSSLAPAEPDAGWLTDWLFETSAESEMRFALLRFAQRRFLGVSPELVPAVGLALMAARDLPALTRAMERMQVRDPRVYAATAVAAYDLTASTGSDDDEPVLARWQAALGLLEHVQRWGPLPEADVTALLEALVRLTPVDPRPPTGAVATWVLDHLLPRVSTDGPVDTLEERALRALTRVRPASVMRFSWEGLRYVADRGDAAFRTAEALRQTGANDPTLADLARVQAARRLLEGITRFEDVGRAEPVLRALGDQLAWLHLQGERGGRLARDLREATAGLSLIREPGDMARIRRALGLVLSVLDLATDLVLPPMVYALAVSPTREPPLLYRDAWRAHSLRPSPSHTFGSWRQTAWQSPVVDARPGGGLMLRGAMLSVDVALGEALLLRPVPPAPRGPRYVIANERETLLRFLAYAHTTTLPEEQSLGALDLGRSVARQWATEIPALPVLQDTLRRAGVGARRATVLAWQAHLDETGMESWLTPLEMLRLAPSPAVPSWFGPAPIADRCSCLQSLEIASPDDLRGRESGVLIAVIANLPLRLAEHLRALELPQGLVSALLPLAIQDWLDQVTQTVPGDWESSAGWLRRLSQERVEEYLLSLIAAGMLVPPETADGTQK